MLLEHVLGTKIALESRRVRDDPHSALEAVEGHTDKLRRQPEAPVAVDGARPSDFLHRYSTPGSTESGRSSGRSGSFVARRSSHSSACCSGQLVFDRPFPDRVAVVCEDEITRSVVANTLATGLPDKTTVQEFRAIEEVVGTDVQVVVICPSPSVPFSWATTALPLRTPGGARRGFCVVGEVDLETQDAIFEQMTGWCELVSASSRSSRSSPGPQPRWSASLLLA